LYVYTPAKEFERDIYNVGVTLLVRQWLALAFSAL